MPFPSYAKFYKPLMTARIPDGAKIVFCALLDFQQLGLLNPKIETLAKAVGKGWKAVQHDLRFLRKAGLIQVHWGQRQSTYGIPENWQILLGQIRASEPNPVRSNPSITLGQIRASETSGPYYFQDSFLRQDSAAAAVKSRTRESGATNGHRLAAAAAAPPPSKKKPSELCRELLSWHPHPQQPERAEVELQRALLSAPAEEIRERHRAWCAYWEANPKHFVPHLWRWFADGDWLLTPRQPAKKLTVLEQLRRMTAAK